MAPPPLNLAILISGGGSNLQAIIDACAQEDYPATIQVVISNVPDAYGLERAKKAGIPAIVINHKDYKSREEFEDDLQKALEQYPVDLICLAGFMRILTGHFVEKWPSRIINTHPALLPNYGGAGMYGPHVHQAVLDAGEEKSGCSIHYVIPEVDQGPVIIQRSVPVLPGDTVDLLAQRIISEEHIAYVEAIRQIAEARH